VGGGGCSAESCKTRGTVGDCISGLAKKTKKGTSTAQQDSHQIGLKKKRRFLGGAADGRISLQSASKWVSGEEVLVSTLVAKGFCPVGDRES